MAEDAVQAAAAEARRRRSEIRLVLAALALVVVLSLWFSLRPRPGATEEPGRSAIPAQPVQPTSAPAPAAQPSSEPAAAAPATVSQPVVGPASSVDSAKPAPVPGIDVAAVQAALAKARSSPNTAVAPSGTTGSDRYPGSQAINVNDVSLPDIGIPVARQVYTTTDPVDTVVSYYQQRYPGAAMTEVNGQKVIAIEGAGTAKVIAVGTTGQETRIAIVQTAN